MSYFIKRCSELSRKPLLFAIPLLIFVAVGFITTEWLTTNRITKNLMFEKAGFQASVSQNIFVQNFRSLLKDGVLLSNIDTKSSNSIKQSLKNYIHKGELEQVWIYDQDCTEISGVKSVAGSSGRCNKSIKGIRLVSSQVDDKLYQFVQAPISFKSKKYFFVASRNIPQSALLKNYVSINSSLQRKSSALAFLSLLLILGSTLLFLGFIKKIRQQISTQKSLSSVQKWLDSRLGDSSIQFTQGSITKKIEHLIKGAVSSTQRQIPDIEQLDQKIKKYEVLLRDVAFWQPIKKWAESFSGKINQKSSAVLQVVQKEQSFFKQKKSVTLDPSIAVLQTWKEGIKERGARKFLRSLSETKSTSRHSDMLMQDIYVIESGFDYLTEAIDKIDHILTSVRDKETIAFKDTLASQKIFKAESFMSFAEALESVQTLAYHQGISYKNLVSKASKDLMVDLNVAAVLLESYQLFNEASIQQSITIKTSYKRKDQLHTLILDCESENLDFLTESQKTTFLANLAVSQKINQNLSVHFSPSLNSLPIVISWHDFGVEKLDLIDQNSGVDVNQTSSAHVVFGQLLE